MSIRHLDALFSPASVAVIGASMRPASVGGTVWRNLNNGDFKGQLYAVNPKHAELDGVKAWASVADLPAAPELAILCTPASAVVDLITALGARGTRAAIVLTAGLTAQQKQAMLDAARVHTLRILGPNCIGMLVPHLGLNASFAHTGALPGELAFVSQSGALVTAMLDWANAPTWTSATCSTFSAATRKPAPSCSTSKASKSRESSCRPHARRRATNR